MSIYSQLAGTAKYQVSTQSLFNQSLQLIPNLSLIDGRANFVIREIELGMTYTRRTRSQDTWFPSELAWSWLVMTFWSPRTICTDRSRSNRLRTWKLIEGLLMDSGKSNHIKLPANIVCRTNTKFSASGDGFHVLNLNYKNVKYLNISVLVKSEMNKCLNFG